MRTKTLYIEAMAELSRLKARPAGGLLAPLASEQTAAGVTPSDLATRLDASIAWLGEWLPYPSRDDPTRRQRVGRLIKDGKSVRMLVIHGAEGYDIALSG